ncbi:MAG TPA: DUF4255 domain-containing protein [Thermoanaerobaculia bacterium]|jgi:hypothetical protein|nr:DUF4255 domain-containing protein [Thermoanaerobaculia bacterium]
MSNSLAIAAVTITLRNLLDHAISSEVSGATVTMQPPDFFTTPSNANHVNLFLYHTSIDAAFRNADMPRQVRPGETGQPPLALNLYYLLTAYGLGDDAIEPLSHRLLGRAMSIFHDHPVLSAADIKAAIPTSSSPPPPPYDLFDQIERVRIIPQPLTLDDMSKLWTTFQAKYRPSAAYQVAVVLIESNRPARTPLPVLRRGQDDRGVDAQSNLTAPYPTLTALTLPSERQPSARLGDVVTLRGHHLDGDAAMIARFRHPRLASPIDIPLAAVVTSGETDVQVTLPNDAAAQSAWAAGSVTVSLVVSRSTDPTNPTRITNELSFALAPLLLTLNPTTASSAAGDFTLTVTCGPEVLPGQRTSLLFGGSEIAADAHTAQTDTLTFRITPVTAASKGDHFLRLRVDGVDSLLVDYQQTPLQFDPNQKVTIT